MFFLYIIFIMEKYLQYINSHLERNTPENNVINFFHRTGSHWLILLYIMKFYYEKKHLNKTHLTRMVIEKINYRKTQVSESKYLKEAISNGYILEINHPTDHRQKVLLPSESTINDTENWLDRFN